MPVTDQVIIQWRHTTCVRGHTQWRGIDPKGGLFLYYFIQRSIVEYPFFQVRFPAYDCKRYLQLLQYILNCFRGAASTQYQGRFVVFIQFFI